MAMMADEQEWIIMMDATRHLLNTTATTNITGGRNETGTLILDASALRETLKTYGSTFVGALILYCILQKSFPTLFAIRSWSEDMKCDLALTQYGLFNWMWRVFWVDDDVVQDQCGMDTLCFFRMLRFGRKLALMSCFNALWLLPLYRVAEGDPPVIRNIASKPFASITIVHVPPGSKRLLGTVVAAYVIFLYAMWLILKEFEWYTTYRHRFLKKRIARNYAVYVSGIPEQYRSSHKLAEYFRRCSPLDSDVLEAQCTLNIPNLEGSVAKRNALQQKLEHARALQELRGTTVNTCWIRNGGVDVVDQVQKLQEEINTVDREIWTVKSNLLRASSRQFSLGDVLNEQSTGVIQASDSFETSRRICSGNFAEDNVDVDGTENRASDHSESDTDHLLVADALEENYDSTKLQHVMVMDFSDSSHPDELRESYQSKEGLSKPILKDLKQRIQQVGEFGVNNVKKVGIHSVHGVKRVGELGVENVLNMAEMGSNIVEGVVGTAVTIVVGHQEGSPREAGFVVFTKLYAVHSALQRIHHATPHVMNVTEAPDPQEIFWRNVGLTERAQRLGGYVSLAATALLCFFWSVPVAFISSLTQLETLEESIPFLKRWLKKAPGFAKVFAQVAPFLLYLLNQLILPNLLKEMSKWEGHIGSASLQASVFIKMAAFMIIQTFFVSAISGSIAAELTNIIENPKSIIDLLANSLPGQSAYFLQIILVGTFTTLAFTMLRVSPLIQAWLRTFIEPRLTEKERNMTWVFLHPLSNPPDFFHGQYTSPLITSYMVIFVYAAITPITSYFLLACFILLESIYRLQFYRNFAVKSDSGGKLWKGFIRIVLVCMVFAELTLVGFLALKKAASASPLMLPLIIGTILFFIHINDKHFKVAATLPTSTCIELDRRNEEQGQFDFTFVQGKYLQPALQPDNPQDVEAN